MFCFALNFAEFACLSVEFLNSLGPANHNRLFFFRISCVCDFWLGKLIRQAHLFPTLCTLFVNSMLIILVFSCLFFSVCHPLGHRNLCSLVHADTFHSPKNCSNLSLLVNGLKVGFWGLFLCLLTWMTMTKKKVICCPFLYALALVLKFILHKTIQHARTKIPLKYYQSCHATFSAEMNFFHSTIQTNKSVWARFTHWRLNIPPGMLQEKVTANERRLPSDGLCGTKSILSLGIITPD